MLPTRVLRNAYTRRMIAELARKGELLGPRAKPDPLKSPKRETIKIDPSAYNVKEASLFFVTGDGMRTPPPTVQVQVASPDPSRMSDQLEEIKAQTDLADQSAKESEEPGNSHKTAQSASVSGTVDSGSNSAPASLSDTSYEDLETEADNSLEELRRQLKQDMRETLRRSQWKEMHAGEDEGDLLEEEEQPREHTLPDIPAQERKEWQKGIYERMKSETCSTTELKNYITSGLKKGHMLQKIVRKRVLNALFYRNEHKAVVELSKKLNIRDLRPTEFQVVLTSAAETNQWWVADKLMNAHWELVEQGPPSVSLIALQVFINVDFSVARAFVHQLMFDKRYTHQEQFQQKVVTIYLRGARTIARNLPEMLRFATQYKDLSVMEDDGVLAELVRGFHRMGTAKQIAQFHHYLHTKKMLYRREVFGAMILRHLYLQDFDKALNSTLNKHVHTYGALVAGYYAMTQRRDYKGLLKFHKMTQKYVWPRPAINGLMRSCLIEAYGASRSMERAIEEARKPDYLGDPKMIAALFKVFCQHYPEKAGDFERLLSSHEVSEVRVLTKDLDLRNMVPMMLLNQSDVEQAVTIASFRGVHLKRKRVIEALVKMGKPERAFKYYTLLLKTEIPFDEHDYMKIIRGLCRHGFLELAEECLAHYEKAHPNDKWRKRVCRLDVMMLRSTRRLQDSAESAYSPQELLHWYASTKCRNGPKSDGDVLGSVAYYKRTGYEYVAVAMHMVTHGMYAEARDLLTSFDVQEPKAYALVAECHARLGDIPEIEKLIKRMRKKDIRADMTYKALMNMSEYHYGTGLVDVLDKLRELVDKRHQSAVTEQNEILKELVSWVKNHEENKERRKTEASVKKDERKSRWTAKKMDPRHAQKMESEPERRNQFSAATSRDRRQPFSEDETARKSTSTSTQIASEKGKSIRREWEMTKGKTEDK